VSGPPPRGVPRTHAPVRAVTRMWTRRATTSGSSSCWVGAGRGAEARFPTPPAEPCMPLSRHTALPLSVILSLDHVILQAKRPEILGLVGIRLPAKDTPGTHASRQIRLNRPSNLFGLEAETLLHFTDIHRYVPLRVRSATSASAFPTDCRPWLPEVVPRFLATMAAPTPVEGIDGPFT
jgi:hypothetical protein